jgi:hypothetical protein
MELRHRVELFAYLPVSWSYERTATWSATLSDGG